MERHLLYALSFDGINGYINHTLGGAAAGALSQFTLSAWFYIRSSKAANSGGLGRSVYNTAGNIGFGMYSSKMYVDARFVTAGWKGIGYHIVEFNKWHNYMATYDGATLKFLRDNTILIASTSVAADTIAASTVFKVGFENASYIDALISNVCLYTRALDNSELQRNMRNPMNPLWNGLVLWLPMIEGQNVNVADYSGQGNNGVASGGVAWYEMAQGDPQADVL
jgi:hypothetical protein